MPTVELVYEEIPAEEHPVPCGIGSCTALATHYVSRKSRTAIAETCRQHPAEEEYPETR